MNDGPHIRRPRRTSRPRGTRRTGLGRTRRLLPVLACLVLTLTTTHAPRALAQTEPFEPSDQPKSGEQPDAAAGPAASGEGAEEGEQAPASASMQLVDQTSWVRPGEELQLVLQLSDVAPDDTLALDIHDRLDSRSQFTETVGGDQLGPTAASSPPTAVAALQLRADGNYEVRYPVPADGGALDGDGVYPVELELADASGTALSTIVTYLLLLPSQPEGFPPLSVATIMEIGTPPAQQPSGAVSFPDGSLERFDERTTALHDAQDVPLTVAPVPETVDALAAAGDTGTDRLDALRTALGRREVLARPYVDVDLDAIAAANLVTEVPPQAAAGATVARTRFGREPLGGVWLTGPTIGQGTIDALRQLGVGRAVVPQGTVADVPEDATVEGPAPTTTVTLTDGGPQALVVDDALSIRLRGTDGRLDAQRFLAELMTIWQTRPGVSRAVVVRIPEDADIDPQLVSTALAGLTDGEAVQARTLGETFEDLAVAALEEGEQPPTVQLAADAAPGDASDGLNDLATPLHDAQTQISGLAATLDDNDLITSLGHSPLIALGSQTPNHQRRAYIGRVRDLLTQVATQVRAPDGFTITLTAREGTIPLTVINDSGRPVVVKVRLSSSQLDFPDSRELILAVPPGQVRQDVRVRTRASGAFPLEVQITSPDGSLVISEATFTIRSTAVSGVGLVLSGGAGLFLLLWWARHWRSARRSRRLIETDPAGTPAIRPPAPQPTSFPRHAGSHRH